MAAVLVAVAGLATQGASASRGMLVGIYDEPHTLYGEPAHYFPLLRELRAQVLRVNLYWGGRFGVAKGRPFDPTDPADPAYNWSLYDRLVNYASQYRVRVLFSIYGTPSWANGGAGVNRAPSGQEALEGFAKAAALRYSGTYPDPTGRILPAVKLWLAWNEPNNPVFLSPQYRRDKGKWVIQSAIDYARICNAIWEGVHSTFIAKEQVACGATSPRGNNAPRSSRPSVSPLAFLRAVKSAGLTRFDAWAHHPYYGAPSETPSTPPRGGRRATAVTLGNIGSLISQLTRLYGKKPLWLTEYGYQTNPPDRAFGVSWAKQAAYLRQAFAIARRNPRITMMLWFMIQDEPILSGWQSGFLTAKGKEKPSFDAFRRVPR
jgi:putative glycosyl hydrolase